MIIMVAMLAQKQRVGRGEQTGSWVAVQAARPLPAAVRSVRSVRLLGPMLGLLVLAAFIVLPSLITNANSVKLTGTMGFIIVGLSVGVITGLGGQLVARPVRASVPRAPSCRSRFRVAPGTSSARSSAPASPLPRSAS